MPAWLYQVEAFTLTLVLGLVSGAFFHFYQQTVRMARIKGVALYVLDFFLWMVMILLIFAALLLINQGEMRIYVLVALLAGAFLYYQYLSPRLQVVVERAVRLTLKLISFLVAAVVRPSRWLAGVITSRFKRPPPPDEGEDELS